MIKAAIHIHPSIVIVLWESYSKTPPGYGNIHLCGIQITKSDKYGSKSAKPPADLLTKISTIKTPKHILFNALKRLFNQMCLLYLNSGVLI